MKKVTASILAAAVALSMTAVGVLPASAAETASVERIFVSTDSTMNASIPANLAFDGDNTTRWGTGHLAKEADSDVPTDPLYIGVDFGESGATFDKITVDWENSYSAPYENGGFVLQYSKNGTSWTDFPPAPPTALQQKSPDRGLFLFCRKTERRMGESAHGQGRNPPAILL